MGTSNLFQLAYDDICELCRRYSRGNFKIGQISKELLSLFFKSATKTRVLWVDINNLFEISKFDSELGVLQDKEKQEEITKARDFCNVPNFGPTIYRHKPIDHDDYIDVLFYIGSKTPLHINMMICFVYWT